MQETPSLRVTRLQESNFKRIVACDINPGRKTLVVLRGPNEAGKTSTIDGLIAALAGKRAHPDVPVRSGADEAIVECELSDAARARYRITRSWKGDRTWLTVKEVGEDGAESRLSAGQTLLDTLVSDLSFDPLAFAKAKDKALQIRMLFGAIGRPEIPDKVANRKSQLAADRRLVNANLKAAEVQLAALPDPAPGSTIYPVTDAQVAARMAAAEAHNAKRRALEADIQTGARELLNVESRITDLEEQLELARESLEQRKAKLVSAKQNLADMAPAVDTVAIAAEVAKIREHNAAADRQAKRREKMAEVQKLTAESETATKALEAVDAKVGEILAASDLGKAVPGLRFVDGELTHNGVPLSQASGMRRLEVSALIGMAANPALRIMTIDEGDQLDDASLARLIELAKERDFSVWMTAIRAGDEQDPDTHVVPVADGLASDATTDTLPTAEPAGVVSSPESFDL